jgi:hypothetical protein
MRSRAHIAGPLLAPLLVALWLAQSLAVLGHGREHGHRYCPAHSAFEEAPAASGLTSGEPLAEGPAVEPPTELASDAGHQVCPCLSFNERKGVLASTPGGLSVLAVGPGDAPSAPAPRQAHSSLAILDLAPQASPPARV